MLRYESTREIIFHDLIPILQVVFEGLAKDSADAYRKYRGYVAVDNVAVRPGPDCRGHCTFEGGFCGWTNQNDDDFDWSLVSISLSFNDYNDLTDTLGLMKCETN